MSNVNGPRDDWGYDDITDDADNDDDDCYEYYDVEGRLMRGDASADRFWLWVDEQRERED